MGSVKHTTAALEERSAAQTFDFTHPFFKQKAVQFSQDSDRRLVIKIDLGDHSGAVTVESVLVAENIPRAHPDRDVLALVETALAYRQVIRPGDRVPSELISGQPSWNPGRDSIQRAFAQVMRGLFEAKPDLGANILKTVTHPESMRDLPHLLAPLEKTIEKESFLSGGTSDARPLLGCICSAIGDLARLETSRRAVSIFNRMVGDLALIGAEDEVSARAELALNAGKTLRPVGAYANECAQDAEAMGKDVQSLLTIPTYAENFIWPILQTLRRFMVDVQDIVLSWRAIAPTGDNSIRQRDLEAFGRLAQRRFRGFTRDRYLGVYETQLDEIIEPTPS